MNTAEKVRNLAERYTTAEREKFTDDARLREDLGMDSLDVVELVMDLEREFNIDIPDEDAEKLRTVGEVVRHVAATFA